MLASELMVASLCHILSLIFACMMASLRLLARFSLSILVEEKKEGGGEEEILRRPTRTLLFLLFLLAINYILLFYW